MSAQLLFVCITIGLSVGSPISIFSTSTTKQPPTPNPSSIKDFAAIFNSYANGDYAGVAMKLVEIRIRTLQVQDPSDASKKLILKNLHRRLEGAHKKYLSTHPNATQQVIPENLLDVNTSGFTEIVGIANQFSEAAISTLGAVANPNVTNTASSGNRSPQKSNDIFSVLLQTAGSVVEAIVPSNHTGKEDADEDSETAVVVTAKPEKLQKTTSFDSDDDERASKEASLRANGADGKTTAKPKTGGTKDPKTTAKPNNSTAKKSDTTTKVTTKKPGTTSQKPSANPSTTTKKPSSGSQTTKKPTGTTAKPTTKKPTSKSPEPHSTTKSPNTPATSKPHLPPTQQPSGVPQSGGFPQSVPTQSPYDSNVPPNQTHLAGDDGIAELDDTINQIGNIVGVVADSGVLDTANSLANTALSALNNTQLTNVAGSLANTALSSLGAGPKKT